MRVITAVLISFLVSLPDLSLTEERLIEIGAKKFS